MKSTYETMGGKYQQNGDYLLPNFEVPVCPKVGVWSERRASICVSISKHSTLQ